MIRKLTLAGISILLLSGAWTQEDHLIFQRIPEGISGNFVRSIVKDSRDYMWFGTYTGLNKFDGTTIINYEHIPNDSNSISHNGINSICEDNNKKLWIGTSQGLCYYNPNLDNFVNLNYSIEGLNPIKYVYISSLYCNNSNKLWAGTFGNGIVIIDKNNFEAHNLWIDTVPSSRSKYVNCIEPCDSLLTWIGTQKGLFLIENQTEIPVRITNKKCKDENITALTTGSEGKLYVANQDGQLFVVTKTNEEYFWKEILVHTSEKNSNQKRILSLKTYNNQLYIGRENGGLTVFDLITEQTKHYSSNEGDKYSLAGNSVWNIYPDETGRIWIGTYRQGVCFYDPYYNYFEGYDRNLTVQPTLTDNNITSFSIDKEGLLWIGTDGGGISLFNLTERKVVKNYNTKTDISLTSNAVICLLNDSKGNTWAGTWGGGIDFLSTTSKKIMNYRVVADGSGDNNIQCLFEDSKGTIWAGTAGSGLFRFDEKANEFVSASNIGHKIFLPNSVYITDILEDHEHRMWISTLFGLLCFPENEQTDSFRFYFNNFMEGSINSNQIACMYQDTENALWFGTLDNGINRYDHSTGKFTQITAEDGLSSNSIKSIIDDNYNNLWVCTNKGISKINKTTQEITIIKKIDGLLSDEFNTNACLRTQDNELLLGTNKGFNIISTDITNKNPFAPVMYFKTLWVNNKVVKPGDITGILEKQIGETTAIRLNHKQQTFTIEYAGISYTHASKNSYAYQLEGFDKTWQQAGTRTQATYTNLSPGKYRFVVKAANNDGTWSSTPAILRIRIKPSFWMSWWAYIVYVIILISAIFLGLNIYHDRISIQNSLEMEKMAREQNQVLNQAKLQFFTNISHELRTPLSLIHAPIEAILNSEESQPEIKEKALTAFKNSSKLMQLVNELMDFRKIDNNKMHIQVEKYNIVKFVKELSIAYSDLANEKNIAFTINTKEQKLIGYFDLNALEKILNNLISNAFKFTPENGFIHIEIKAKQQKINDSNVDFVSIIVTNSGKGVDEKDIPYIFDRFYQSKTAKKQGSGIGLSLVKSLCELHHGSVEVQSIPNQTTSFIVQIPVSESIYSPEEFVTESESPSSFTVQDGEADKQVSATTGNSDRFLVLIVEDNDELRTYIANELIKDFEIITAKNGKEGFHLAKEKIPDLILSDVLMPEMDGTELCFLIKKEISTCHIPIVLLTAKTTVDDKVKGIETGADVYITKPFSIRFLKSQVNRLIENRNNLYKIFSQEVHLTPGKIAKNKIDEEFLNTIINYIVDNCNDKQLSVEILADNLNLSRGQLYKKIKALTGQSAVEFIRSIRLKEAVRLMETRKYSLTEIAYQTGFTSPSYFTRSFKAQYGKSPSEFLDV
ncbi:MAG: response regulator [Bacteroidales bacterium]|nr:response regulator [Bacteroidales bacterium]MBN2819951.1 response regulator [Bacteroidales bacterium]